jgi:hypothetical protein
MNRHTPRGRAARFVPRLEALEQRSLLSCTVTFNQGVLLIKGDAQANHVKVFDNGLNSGSPLANVSVACDGQSQQFAHVQVIKVRTLGGNDTVRYELSQPLVGFRAVEVDLGGGDDAFTANLRSHLTAFSHLDLEVRGDSGRASGTDTLVLNAVNVTIDGELDANLDGGAGNDRIFVSQQGLVGGQVELVANGGPGNDKVIAGLSLAPLSNGIISAHVLGSNGNDRLQLNVTGGFPSVLDALIDGGAGVDVCAHTGNLDVFGCP